MTPRKIAYYLRHPGNLHYFASIKPYLDYFVAQGAHQNRIVVQEFAGGYADLPEYAGYSHLFTDECDLAAYDLVLTPTFLRESDANSDVRAVHIFHGMSDKPFTYDRDFSDYLLCLCAGQRQADRLRRHPHNRAVRLALVGYPKFESFYPAPAPFANDKKTLIYCPTWRKGNLSSVARVLDHPDLFEQLAQRYNLIVKPHPNLLNKRREFYDAGIVERLEQIPGARLIHCGNVMPWMAQADLFLGDISASGYEWLYFGRPMIFINPQPGRFKCSEDIDAPTYLWRCGDVCEDLRDLPQLLAKNLAHDDYRATREALLDYSVYKAREHGATTRAVGAIEVLFEEMKVQA